MITDVTGKKAIAASQLGVAEALAPASRLVKLTKGDAIPSGGCRFVWSGAAGTINGEDAEGNTITDFPLVAGRNDISLSVLAAGGTATDVWGCW